MRLQRQSTGQSITLDTTSPLGVGGEARIYGVPQDPSLVAKVYHRPTDERARKLAVMLANPPGDPMANEGHNSIAWPVDLLYSEDGKIVGFLMPMVTGMRSIFEFYNPRTRRRNCPQFNYRYLHRSARNLAAAMRALHERSYVIGDVNESNILVSDTALVTLVDTDSFQVHDPLNGDVFRCTVGKPEFTPPELQGKTFADIDRGPEHDLFGLAVLIFQLLMEGTHPFAGIFQGKGDPPLYQERISAGHFPYSSGKRVSYLWRLLGRKRVSYFPLPSAPPFEILCPPLQRLFLRCFEDRQSNPKARPDAQTWQRALDDAENTLVTCSDNYQHRYSDHLKTCPWCERSKQLMDRDPFPARQSVRGYTSPAQVPLISVTAAPPKSTRAPIAARPSSPSPKQTVQTRPPARPIPRHSQPTQPSLPPKKIAVSTPPTTSKAAVPTKKHATLSRGQQATGQPVQMILPLKHKTLKGQDKPMLPIPAGEFEMGSTDGTDDERPVHIVYLDAFYIDKYEVTNAQYRKFLEANPEWRKDLIDSQYHDGNYLRDWTGNNYPRGKEAHPVIYVSWHAAEAYAEWVGKRLPTEAEWEKAARGVVAGRKYPWGNNISHDDANYKGTNGRDLWIETAPVGSFEANYYGLYDMVGNIWEWCADRYDSDYYAKSPRRNPIGPSSGLVRVWRGGSWCSNPEALRVANRHSSNAKGTYPIAGFRCAQDAIPF